MIDAYLEEVTDAIRKLSRPSLLAALDVLMDTWRAGRQALIIGNGGSAATASHLAGDLNKATQVEGANRFRALALTDNTPYLTAIGNDLDFTDIFIEQLKNFLRPGDVLIAISASGNSINILLALDYARRNGSKVLGLCGFPGGQLAKLADVAVIFPAPHIGPQEDGHLMISHLLCNALRERIQKESVTHE